MERCTITYYFIYFDYYNDKKCIYVYDADDENEILAEIDKNIILGQIMLV